MLNAKFIESVRDKTEFLIPHWLLKLNTNLSFIILLF